MMSRWCVTPLTQFVSVRLHRNFYRSYLVYVLCVSYIASLSVTTCSINSSAGVQLFKLEDFQLQNHFR